MSNLIQSTRTSLGISGAELASRLGVTRGAVSLLERSERAGTIRLDKLDQALAAMGRRAVHTAEDGRIAKYGAESVTDALNRALDDGDETFALRLLTRAVQVLHEQPESFGPSDFERTSSVKDRKWETLFGALYGGALPVKDKPDWARPASLSRRWYVSQFASLRERSKTTTPPELRRLNIFIDAQSLTRV